MAMCSLLFTDVSIHKWTMKKSYKKCRFATFARLKLQLYSPTLTILLPFILGLAHVTLDPKPYRKSRGPGIEARGKVHLQSGRASPKSTCKMTCRKRKLFV